MTDNLPTRRELRDRERAIQERLAADQFLNQQPAVVVPPAPVNVAPVAPVTPVAPVAPPVTPLPPLHGRRAAVPVDAQPPAPTYDPQAFGTPAYSTPAPATQPAAAPVAPVTFVPVTVPPAAVTPDTISPATVSTGALTIPSMPVVREIETNTNSIVLDVVPSIENSTIVIKTSDDQTRLIRTGAIDIPPLQNITGEVEVVRAAAVADQHIEATTTGSNAIYIEPQPARRFTARKREQVFPGKLSKGMGSVHTVLATAIIMATLGAVFVIAFMLKLI